MAPNMKSMLLLLMVIAATFNSGKAWVLIPPRVTVRIINILDPSEDVTVHCKSKDDDIGEHIIKVGDNFEFHFRPKAFVDVTLFFCSFKWQSDPSSLHYFDIYNERRDQWCTTCEWSVSQQGVCIYNEAFMKFKCYNYHSVPQATFVQPLGFNTSNSSTV